MTYALLYLIGGIATATLVWLNLRRRGVDRPPALVLFTGVMLVWLPLLVVALVRTFRRPGG